MGPTFGSDVSFLYNEKLSTLKVDDFYGSQGMWTDFSFNYIQRGFFGGGFVNKSNFFNFYYLFDLVDNFLYNNNVYRYVTDSTYRSRFLNLGYFNNGDAFFYSGSELIFYYLASSTPLFPKVFGLFNNLYIQNNDEVSGLKDLFLFDDYRRFNLQNGFCDSFGLRLDISNVEFNPALTSFIQKTLYDKNIYLANTDGFYFFFSKNSLNDTLGFVFNSYNSATGGVILDPVSSDLYITNVLRTSFRFRDFLPDNLHE